MARPAREPRHGQSPRIAKSPPSLTQARAQKGYVPASYLGSTIEVDTCQLPYFCGQALDDDIAANLNEVRGELLDGTTLQPT